MNIIFNGALQVFHLDNSLVVVKGAGEMLKHEIH